MKHESILNQPVIETERFDLRPLRKSDMGLIDMYTDGMARNKEYTLSQ